MLTTLLSLFLAVIPLPQKPDHYVTDRAGVMPADRVEAIDAKLKSFEQATSTQVIVYIDHKIPEGTTLEEMGAQAIHQWGVGQKGKDNGAIVFIFTDDRKMRIEVGYGLEGTLTDARSKLITSELMKPKIRNGDYAGAVDAAVNAIINFSKGEDYKGGGTQVAQANASATAVGLGIFGTMFLFFLAFVLLMIFIFTRRNRWATALNSGTDTSSSTTDWSPPSSSSSDWSSSSDSSSSSSDFSGGGGDGGGGGASDSW